LLGFWRTHDSYQERVVQELSKIAIRSPFSVLEYENSISKVYILDLDVLHDDVVRLYSHTGRPAELQPEIFRSLVLMNDLGYSLDEWVHTKLTKNPVLQAACGFFGELPRIASYYDFIDRIIKLDERPRVKKKKRKPKNKIGKGKKLSVKRPGVVAQLVTRILDGRRFNNRPERLLQEIFAKICVQKSIDLGLIPQNVTISGDGTCIETGASHFGVKVCECSSRGDYHCDCLRRFSDPNAAWGWDSHNEHWFYGYTGYFISTYNKVEKLDLPLYLRLVEASRHDSVSAVVALAEFRDLYPNLTIDTFISDSASDNYATYELLHAWNINAVIALNSTNKGNFKYPEALNHIDGVPVCPGGHMMIHWGFCGKDRCRIKFRCPRVLGKAEPCDACNNCSPSSYGRVIYTKPDWDLRLFSKIPRGTEAWKSKMKERTAAERVNNRILHHYGIKNSKNRGKKRISFFTTIAAINIHLDAQLAILKRNHSFDFAALLGLNAVVAA